MPYWPVLSESNQAGAHAPETLWRAGAGFESSTCDHSVTDSRNDRRCFRDFVRWPEELVAGAAGRHALGPEPGHERPQERFGSTEKIRCLPKRRMACEPIGFNQAGFIIILALPVARLRVGIESVDANFVRSVAKA